MDASGVLFLRTNYDGGIAIILQDSSSGKLLIHNRHLIIFIPVLHRCKPGDFFEYTAESLCVGVAYIIHYFIDVFAAAFKTSLCCFDLHPLNIFEHWCGCLFKTPLKCSPADSPPWSGQLINGNPFIDILFNIVPAAFLSPYHYDLLSFEHGKCCLAAAVNINSEILRSGCFRLRIFSTKCSSRSSGRNWRRHWNKYRFLLLLYCLPLTSTSETIPDYSWSPVSWTFLSVQ